MGFNPGEERVLAVCPVLPVAHQAEKPQQDSAGDPALVVPGLQLLVHLEEDQPRTDIAETVQHKRLRALHVHMQQVDVKQPDLLLPAEGVQPDGRHRPWNAKEQVGAVPLEPLGRRQHRTGHPKSALGHVAVEVGMEVHFAVNVPHGVVEQLDPAALGFALLQKPLVVVGAGLERNDPGVGTLHLELDRIRGVPGADVHQHPGHPGDQRFQPATVELGTHLGTAF